MTLSNIGMATRNTETSLFFPEAVIENGVMVNFEEVFEMGKVLGWGSESTVRLAVQKTTGKKFAIKHQPRSDLKFLFETIRGERKTRFSGEAERLKKLLGLGSVVNFYGTFFFPARLYGGGDFLILEYLEGVTLGSFVDSFPLRISGEYPNYPIDVLKWLLKVMIDTETLGVSHSDLHDQNIMVCAIGDKLQFVLFDFGNFFPDDQEDISLVTIVSLIELLQEREEAKKMIFFLETRPVPESKLSIEELKILSGILELQP